MRYRETGEVHLDFYRTLNGTIAWLREQYGDELLDETFRRTARDVYRSIHDDLRRGDDAQLVEHWTYYLEREGGRFTVTREDGEVSLAVEECPAIAYLKGRGIAIDPAFCRQTVVLNEALAEGTPFDITTEVLGEGRCRQTIRRSRP
jgi:predicted ArsR family transcriptional regulator